MAIEIQGMAVVSAAREAVMVARGRYDDASDRGYPAREAAAMKQAEAAYTAIKAQYPVAAAWMLADSYEMASHCEKSAAGRKAKARIEAGEEAGMVIAEMKSAWNQAAARCVDNS